MRHEEAVEALKKSR
jgi:tetratricopeptide (TPR) repeat protein